MAILAANCPCCGRDIGFDESVKEYTCIFCGAKLITAALVKERVEHSHGHSSYEHYRKDDFSDKHRRSGSVVRERETESKASAKQTEKPDISFESKPAEKKPEPELTEDEIREQLMRKAEFKQELRDIVKEIDTLRSQRTRFTPQLNFCRMLMIFGLIFIAVAAAIVIIFDGAEDVTRRVIIAAVVAGLGLIALIVSEIKKNAVKKQQKKLEETISEKKEKRDILIGRLNKINKLLHIHSDDK